MGSSSVTGKGNGSAEGELRQFTSMDWFYKIRGIEGRQLVDGTISDDDLKNIAGLSRMFKIK